MFRRMTSIPTDLFWRCSDFAQVGTLVTKSVPDGLNCMGALVSRTLEPPYALVRQAARLQRAANWIERGQQEANYIRLTARQLESLWNHLRTIPDFRQPRGLRHPLVKVLVIAPASVCQKQVEAELDA